MEAMAAIHSRFEATTVYARSDNVASIRGVTLTCAKIVKAFRPWPGSFITIQKCSLAPPRNTPDADQL